MAADTRPADNAGGAAVATLLLWLLWLLLLLKLLMRLCKFCRGLLDKRALFGEGTERVWSSVGVGVSATIVTTVVLAWSSEEGEEPVDAGTGWMLSSGLGEWSPSSDC